MKRLCYINCDELVGELVCQDKDFSLVKLYKTDNARTYGYWKKSNAPEPKLRELLKSFSDDDRFWLFKTKRLRIVNERKKC